MSRSPQVTNSFQGPPTDLKTQLLASLHMVGLITFTATVGTCDTNTKSTSRIRTLMGFQT